MDSAAVSGWQSALGVGALAKQVGFGFMEST
jgi:hypothetical protein